MFKETRTHDDSLQTMECGTSLSVHSAPSHHAPDSLLKIEKRCNDLLQNATVCSYFSGIRKQLSDVQKMVLEYKIQTRTCDSHGTNISPSGSPVQECGYVEETIPQTFSDTDVLRKRDEHHLFLNCDLSLWLDDKEREIRILERFLLTLEKNEHIAFSRSSCELDAIVNEPKYDHVVFFKFTIPSNGEEDLYKMWAFINAAATENSTTVVEDGTNSTCVKLPWYKDKEEMKCIRKQMRQFVSFANANKRDKIKFVVSFCDGEEYASSITLYMNGIPEEFDPPVNPDHVKPSQDGVTHCSIRLEWSKPEYGSDSVQQYTVCYGQKDEQADQWMSKTTTTIETSLTLKYLQSESVYLFKVRAECEAGVSEYSQVSDPILTLQPPPSHLSDILEHSSVLPLSEGRLPVYLIHNDDSYIQDGFRHVRIGKPNRSVKNKVLMVLGATGAGKSTLINGMVNYILEVQWKDDFRFKLITDKAKSQAQSQANNITVYTIHAMPGSQIPYSFTIIDTPGFEDTSGLEQDLLIMAKIKQFFSMEGTSISHLNGIGLVAQSALMRLTPTQKYVFDSILSIFGRDVTQSIFLMITFADGQTPPVMTAIREANIPHADVFKFNNSALYALDSSDGNNFDEMFWKMGMESFKKFFTLFSETEDINLITTRKVLEVRDEVLTLALEFHQLMKECLTEIELLQQAKTCLLTVKAEVSANKDFTQEIQVEYKTTDVETALWKRKKTFPELKKRYESALIRKATIEKDIDTHHLKLEGSYATLRAVASGANERLLTLKQIALNPFPFARINYIQLLINLEQKEAKKGWLDRVSFMETTKEQVKILSILRCTNFEDIDSQIKKEKQLKIDGWEEIVGILENLQRISVTTIYTS